MKIAKERKCRRNVRKITLKKTPPILEESKEQESAISTKDGPNSEDMALLQGEQSEAIKGREEEKQNEVLEESETGAKEISILGGVGM